jgi:ADP-heptose:LPS heptosyltransferase
MHAFTIRMHQALGDAVALSAVVRDLKRQHPQYRLALFPFIIS